MNDLVRYNSFEELKASSDGIDTDVDNVKERHKRFAEAMRLWRDEYLRSKAPSDQNPSVTISTVYGLQH